MREDILRELRDEYTALQAKSEETLLERTAELREKHPDLFELTEERKSLIYSSLRGILRGEKQETDLPAAMQDLNRKIEDLLEQKGYGRDWLEPVYRCTVCRDTGYTGEPVREMCSCLKKRYQEKLNEKDSLISGTDESFEAFNLALFSEEKLPGHSYSPRDLMIRFRNYSEAWANQWPDTTITHIVLMGQTGLGKTFLLNAIARRLRERGVNAVTVSSYHFQELARKVWFGDEDTDGLDNLLNADVLLMDDVGTEPMMRNITVEQLFNLINERDIHGRATVLSTNLSRSEFNEKYTERIASRVMDQRNSLVMVLHGNDLRTGK